MRNMNKAKGSYSNEYMRNYARQFFENQNVGKVDALSGASSSAGKFEKLAPAVFEQAKKGDTAIAVIDVGA